MCYEATSCLHNYSKFIRRFKKNKLLLCVSFDYSNNDLCALYSAIFSHSVEQQFAWDQGRIYVANEYPTFARTMSMVGQKLTFSSHITSNVRQNLPVLMKNMQILG